MFGCRLTHRKKYGTIDIVNLYYIQDVYILPSQVCSVRSAYYTTAGGREPGRKAVYEFAFGDGIRKKRGSCRDAGGGKRELA